MDIERAAVSSYLTTELAGAMFAEPSSRKTARPRCALISSMTLKVRRARESGHNLFLLDQRRGNLQRLTAGAIDQKWNLSFGCLAKERCEARLGSKSVLRRVPHG